MQRAMPIWHPCTQMKDHETWPPVRIVRGQGIYLYDAEGNAWIDAISSWWVNLFGHTHPRLVAALKAQLDRLEQVIFAGFTHEPAEQLARGLLALTPETLTHVFFADNGSCAVEAALKMSYGFWRNQGRPEKRHFVHLTHGYHGETLGALSLCGDDFFAGPYREIMVPGIRADGPDCFRCPRGRARDACDVECSAGLERILAERGHEIAAVILEPLIQCAGGFRMYPPAWLARARELTRAAGVHLIVDEIATGFGRTGRMFAAEHAGVAGDFVCLSKGITGGMLPLSAVLTTDEVFDAFYHDWAEAKGFMHSHSYTGNALACAAAVETLAIFRDEDVLHRNIARQRRLEEAVRERFSDLPCVGEVRSCGFVCAVELVADRATKRPFDWRARTGFRIYRQALERGALLRNLGDIVYFMPPYVIEAHEIDRLADIALAATRAVLP